MDHILPFAAAHALLPRDGLILCAVSGGADSVALLHFLRSNGFRVHAAHFDHHLRKTSGRDAAFVRDLCAGLDVPFSLGEGQVGQMPGNTEENARTARYAFLEATADAVGADVIATAHNANDNLETMLFHLARGCGLQGLAGIQPRRGRLVRPMLHTTRAAIEDYVRAQGLSFVTDETNADDAYARNRIRHQVVPVLESVNPRAVEAAARTADRLRLDLEEVGPWTPEPDRAPLPPLEPRQVAPGERVETPLWTLELTEAVCPDVPPTPEVFYLQPRDDLALRSRRTGDFIHPPFRTGKSVKKWLIELAVPRQEREVVPVLTAGEDLLAVAGIGPERQYLARPGQQALRVQWQKRERSDG